MAQLSRAIQKPFGATGATGEFAQIGSKASGVPATTKNLETMQALAEYAGGMADIVSDQGTSVLPYMEDMNALFYLLTTQASYLLQNGIPEWLNSAEQYYYANVSFVTGSDGNIYQAILGDDSTNLNVQKDPVSQPLWWRLVWAKPAAIPWDTGEASAYDVAGVITDRAAIHFASSGKTGNSNKDPLNQANHSWWVPSPGINALMERTKHPYIDLHPAFDRASGDYQNFLLRDKATLAGTLYNFWDVALDGSVVTGDANLEAALDVGGANQHPLIDIIAPDAAGTRTLIDLGEYMMAAQSASGDNATLGALLLDRLQGHRMSVYADVDTAGDSPNPTNRAFAFNSGTSYIYKDSSGGGATTTMLPGGVRDFTTDGTNGTPRTGLTTRGKQFVNGAMRITSMVPAA